MDEKFNDWLEEFDKDFRKSKAWNNIQRYGENEKDLFNLYVQYQSGKETKSLLKATWILAISTIILTIATIALVFVT